MRVIILTIVVALVACERQSYEIETCITQDALENRYGELINSIFEHSSLFTEMAFPEIHKIEHERRVLSVQRRMEAQNS